MFKKGQLVRITKTGEVVVVIGKMDYLGYSPVTTIAGTNVGYCFSVYMKLADNNFSLIGNNFKFKGAK